MLWYRGETARSRTMVAAAVELLEREPPGYELAAAYLELGKDVAASGQPTQALDWLRKAISLADCLGADDIRQRALQLRGCARGEIGDLSGLADVRESVELGLRLGLGRGTALAHGNLGNELFKFEGPAAALPPLEAGLALCQERGIAEEAHWLSVGIVDCLAELGRWNQAMRLADQLLARHADLAESYEGVNLAARKAHILLFRGARTEAGLLKERFLSRGRHIGDLQVVANVFPIAALIEQASGDFHAAALLIDELERATRNGPACYRAMPLPDAVRVCAATGRLTLAERFLEDAEAPGARYQHCLVTAQAVLAEAHGELQEAAELYADASDRWSNFGVVLEHAQALSGLGRCAARLGRRSSARDWLLDARKIFSQLDARPLLAETDGWLHQESAETS